MCFIVIINMENKNGGVGHVVKVEESHLFFRKYKKVDMKNNIKVESIMKQNNVLH